MKRSTILAALLIAFIAALYYSVLKGLVLQWYDDPNYSHGFLIPFISFYLLWECRHEVLRTPLRPSNWGLVVLFIGFMLLGLGNIAAELFTTRLSLIVLAFGFVLFIFGSPMLRRVQLPLAFSFLMIPLPAIVFNQVAFPLQTFAAETAEVSLDIVQIPVFREGNIIHLANTSLEVAEACSGLRSLMSLIALGIIFGYFSQKSLWRRLFLVLSTIPIAILANAFRVSGTGILAYYLGPSVAEGFYHTFSGLLLFGMALMLLLMEGYVLSFIGRRPKAEGAKARAVI